MKISYSWLKDYVQTNWSAEEIADKLTFSGLEIEGLNKTETVPGGLEGVVVGEVIKCENLPDSDHLHITEVNIGEDKPLQIVCGAPNVAKSLGLFSKSILSTSMINNLPIL
jgi:phenylalanyl-tRNA synthetase beta chain